MIFQNFGFNQNYPVAAGGAPVDPDLKIWLDAGNASSYPGTGTAWNDLTSNGNNLVIVGAPTYNSTTGSFYFLTNAQYANSTTATNLSVGTGPQSTEVWTRYLGPDDNNYYFVYENGSNLATSGQSNRMQFSDNGFGDGFEMAYGGIGLVNYVPPYDGTHDYTKINMYNVWKQCVMVRDGNTVYYYINGGLVTSRTGFSAASLTNTNNLYIGKSISFGDGYNGDIAIFKIYNKALTAAEILANYNAYKTRFGL